MNWEAFLKEIVKEAKLEGKPKRGFLETHRCQELEELEKRNTSEIAKALDYKDNDPSNNAYFTLMKTAYNALDSLLQADGIELPRGPGKRRGDPNRIKVHQWLLDRYQRRCEEYEREQREREFEAIQGIQKLENRLHNELTRLNYCIEEAVFRTRVDRGGNCSAFLIRVDGRDAQAWLVRRLAERIRKFENSERVPIDLKSLYLNENLRELWNALANREKFADITDDDKIRIIESIVERCSTKNLIIALYNVDELSGGAWKCLWEEFWLRLIEQLKNQKIHGRCILFLTARVDFGCSGLISDVHKLDAWKNVLEQDWQAWLDEEEVQQLWEQSIGNLPIIKFDQECPKPPQKLLEEICSQLGLDDGLLEGIDVMRHRIWKLTA